MRLALAHTVALGILALFAGVSSADPPTRIAVVVDTVDVSESVTGTVRVAAELTVRDKRMKVVELDDARSGGLDISELGACATKEAGCVRNLLSKLPVDRVLYIALRTAVTGDVEEGEEEGPPDLSVTARMFDARSGALLALDQRLCPERCQQRSEFSSIIREMTGDLVAAETSSTPGAPPPAEPAPRRLAPPATPTPEVRDAGPARPFRALKFVALGAGLAAVASGVTLVVIDGPRVDGGERLPDERATRTPGFVAIGTGVALVGAGIALWLLESEPDSGIAASASVGHDTVNVGVAGRF